MKKVMILEDSPNTRECLEKLVKETDSDVYVFGLSNVKDAYQVMMEHTIDLFIIDIILDVRQSGDISGLYFAERVRAVEKYLFTPMIFVTSLDDAKHITYERLHCYSFIEKPFDPYQVRSVIEQCLKYSAQGFADRIVYFRSEGVIFSINLAEVIYVESKNRSLYIYMRNEEVVKLPYLTIKAFLQEADSSNLLQCSRSFVVNIAFIRNIDITNRMIILSNGYQVEIGLKYKKVLRDFIHASYNCICS